MGNFSGYVDFSKYKQLCMYGYYKITPYSMAFIEGANFTFYYTYYYIAVCVCVCVCVCMYVHTHTHTHIHIHTQKYGAVWKVNKKFISYLTRAQRTP